MAHKATLKHEMNKQWPFLNFSKIVAHKIYVKMDITNCFIYNYGYKNQMLLKQGKSFNKPN